MQTQYGHLAGNGTLMIGEILKEELPKSYLEKKRRAMIFG
jgi:hypothetical protein